MDTQKSERTAHVTENANRLLDRVIEILALKNDADLARALGVPPPVISKLRHHRLPVGPTMLIRIHEETGLPIREIKSLLTLE